MYQYPVIFGNFEREALEEYGDPDPLVRILDAYYMDSCWDDYTVNSDWGNSVMRVGRFLLVTNSDGISRVETYADPDQAAAAFDEYAADPLFAD